MMKCYLMLHFIWVFTVYQSTHLGVSDLQRVKRFCVFTPNGWLKQGMTMLQGDVELCMKSL